MIPRFTAFPFLLSISIYIVGCAPTADQNAGVPVMTEALEHNHGGHGHAHPQTLGETLDQLTTLRDIVRDAFANDDSEVAHGPLHDVGHILEEVSKLAGNAELSDEAKATVETNVEALLDAFGAVDKKMHSADGSEGSDYKDVSEKIDAAIAAIAAAVAPALKSDGDEGHDHEGEGHDEHADHDHEDGDHKDTKDKDAEDAHEHKDGEKKDADNDEE